MKEDPTMRHKLRVIVAAAALLSLVMASRAQAQLAAPGESFALPKDRRSTTADRVGDVAASVGLFPGVGEECDARDATPAVR